MIMFTLLQSMFFEGFSSWLDVKGVTWWMILIPIMIVLGAIVGFGFYTNKK